ncbi:MAG: hypothetical protein ACRDIY_10085 [Chloroflexota bacterium]
MSLASRRTFVKILAGLLAFVPASRALAAGVNTPLPRTGNQPAPRVEKYLGGWVTGVAPGRVKVRSYDGEYILRLAANSQLWKGAWNSNSTVEVGDRVEAWGTRQVGGFFDVERMWVNIVNLIGPVSNIHETANQMQLSQRDRFRGLLSVTIDPQTIVVSNRTQRLYSPGQLRLTAGESAQIIGLLLKDVSVRATRVFA